MGVDKGSQHAIDLRLIAASAPLEEIEHLFVEPQRHLPLAPRRYRHCVAPKYAREFNRRAPLAPFTVTRLYNYLS